MSPAYLSLLTSGLLLTAPAAGYERRQGPAVLRLDAPVGKDGRVEVPLAGTTLTVRIEGKAPMQATWEELRSPSWKIRKNSPRENSGPPATWEQQFYVEPLGKPGDASDLKWVIRYREDNQPERRLEWNLPVRITTEVPDASLNEMRPPTPPERVPPAWSWRDPASKAEAALVLLVLALIIGELIRRRFRRRVVLAPAVWAERELDRLAGLDLSAAPDAERFPTLLSDVVRRYLELRFRLPASRQTTAEFLAASQDFPQLGDEHKALLRDLLQTCDLAKFARASLPEEEYRVLLARARGFVKETAAEKG